MTVQTPSAQNKNSLIKKLSRAGNNLLNCFGYTSLATLGVLSGVGLSHLYPTYPIENQGLLSKTTQLSDKIGDRSQAVGYCAGLGAMLTPVIENPSSPGSYLNIAFAISSEVTRRSFRSLRETRPSLDIFLGNLGF